jgi:hypothetical protein
MASGRTSVVGLVQDTGEPTSPHRTGRFELMEHRLFVMSAAPMPHRQHLLEYLALLHVTEFDASREQDAILERGGARAHRAIHDQIPEPMRSRFPSRRHENCPFLC